MPMIPFADLAEISYSLVTLKDGQTLADVIQPGDELIVEYRGYIVHGKMDAIGTDGKVKIDGAWDVQIPIAVYKVTQPVSKKNDQSATKK